MKTDPIKEKVLAWKEAALADGWSCEPTYGTENIDRACKMRKDGFQASLLTREPTPPTRETCGNRLPVYSLSIWCPEGLAIRVKFPYDWQQIKDGVHECMECGERADETFRVGFAGRCCKSCLPAARAKHEKPGWCD